VLLIHICILSLAIHPMTKVTGVLAILNKKGKRKTSDCNKSEAF